MNSTGSDTPNPRSRPRSFITAHRTNLFLLVAFLLISLGGCGGCGGGCKLCTKENLQQAVERSCQLTGMVVPGCHEICQFKVQFYDEATGNNLTNVRSGSKVDFDIVVTGHPTQYFYDMPIQSDGTLTFNSNPCFDCENQIFDPTILIYDPTLKTEGDGCPTGQCRQWGFSSGSQSGLSLSGVENGCVVVFRVPVVKRSGPCRPC